MQPTVTAKYVDVFTDFGFKKIFGEEANKNILIDFLNALLPAEARIKDLTFKNTEQLPVTPIERKAVYDIYCENERGEKFIVELQKAKQNYFMERTIYYSTFPISAQAPRGTWDFNLKAVYCIGLLDFKFSDYDEEAQRHEVVHTHTLKNQHNRQVYKKLTYIYLEMPNFTKGEQELQTRLDKWLYFIKNLEDFRAIPEIFKNEVVFIEAIEKAELAKMSEADLASYYSGLKAYRDNINTFNTAITEAREKGLEEGREEGREQGIEIGQKKERTEMATKCLQRGMPITDISALTGLTEEEIRSIII
jgi:predicted transposase/invertase (TIGR01784 family)